jgi:hypothetical protein
MKDSEILATVFRWMSQSIDRAEDDKTMARKLRDCRDYIQTEWQKEDEREDWRNEVFLKNDDGQRYIMDAREMERHRGLEIGKDGTVTNLK